MTLTQTELDTIRARAEAATEGPWRKDVSLLTAGVNDGSNPYWNPSGITEGECAWCENFELFGTIKKRGANYHVHANIPEEQSIVSPVALATIVPDVYLEDADAEFIAAARQDVPKLLAEVARLQSHLTEIVGAVFEHIDEGHELYDIAEAMADDYK